ncbi:carboxy terminal-processing peptidase [Pedobacter sp. SD-b]|uniref:Carboxy terminal-processing peptidase n=1 Tax=Pedobacter segetis TaxID=2793069 RepID=A0ABS1BM25_9SPHI|nr:carboxy terminal-processing peptidase [Pedobacter segetis]MBK0383796.1 carboxy terminal-processing peptidase [Pedobacter segetis]
MLKRVFLGLFIAATIACSAAPRITDIDVPGSNNLKPDPRQSLVTKEIAELVTNLGYKKISLNDSLGSVIFNNYLKDLDGNKSYFLASDIKDFEQYRTTFDDDMKNGDLTAAFYMFNVYQKRYNERLQYSLKELQNKFDFTKPETYTYDREKLPYFKNIEESNQSWAKKVKYDYLNLKLSNQKDSVIKANLTKRYDNLLSQSKKINNQDAFQIIMTAFTSSIDPHTSYFNPANAANFNIDMARSLEGIGATLSSENDFVTIKSIVPGGPADKIKKLAIDDKIIGVAQGNEEFVDVVGWRLDNAIELIRGKKGTTVRLKILSKNQDLSATPKIISIVRDKIILEDQSVQKKIKSITKDGKTYNYGIIEIPAFYADWKAMQAGNPNYKSTTRDVKMILDSLKNENVDGVIIDLRGNGGGSLNEAIDLTGLFITKGPVVQVKDYRGKVEVDEDEDPSVSWSGPLAIMTDRFSASASEIFAGAIQDYGRGIIIGNTTYGKGTVQSAIAMKRIDSKFSDKDDQINLTMGKFYRINGNSTQHKGVIPDILFPTVFPADKYGESSEPSALPFDTIRSSNYTKVADLKPTIAELNVLHNQRMKTSKDYEYLLQDIQEFKKKDAETTLPLNEEELKKQRDEQEEKNLKRDNDLRKLRGLPPLKKGEAKPLKEENFDFIQNESMKIMTDYIADPKIAKK